MIYIAIGISIFVLDFFVKKIVDKRLELNKSQKICKDKLILRKYYNDGAALNFLAKRPKVMRGIHTMLLAMLSGIYGYVLQLKGQSMLKVALSFMVGGGASNLYDRYRYEHVVDYVSFPVRWEKLRNVIFNISDFFIMIGAILAILSQRKK